MTPNNILNMAMLKGLDFVAITDHNSAKQLPTIREIEQAYDFIIIPGIEVTVSEHFDVLCYFPTYEQAYQLDDLLDQYRVDDWGPFSIQDQVISDIYDDEKDYLSTPLMKTSIPYDTLNQVVHDIGGITILAHIERKSKSAMLYYTLDELSFDGIEIQSYEKESFLHQHPELLQYKILTSSDSHTLLTILERQEYLELKEKSIEAFFAVFKESKHE